MKTLFNKKFEQLLKEYGGPLDLQVNRKHGGNYTGSTDDDETAYDDEAEESKLGKKTDKQKDIESLKALRAKPDKRHAEKNYGSIKKYQDMLTKKINNLKGNDEEAEDRCKRKADSVYGGKTSAYKSGAIVRCRKGNIWKKK